MLNSIFVYVAGKEQTCVLLLSTLADLPEHFQTCVDPGSSRAAPSPNDCVCLVKQYMGSEKLAQSPILVLTEARAMRVGLVPSQKPPVSSIFASCTIKQCSSCWQLLICCFSLRHGNSYSAAFRQQCLPVARAVEKAYGADYSRALEYLKGLASNKFYREGVLADLTWLSTPSPAPSVGEPVYNLHPTVLQSLMPSVALRVFFGGRRDR